MIMYPRRVLLRPSTRLLFFVFVCRALSHSVQLCFELFFLLIVSAQLAQVYGSNP